MRGQPLPTPRFSASLLTYKAEGQFVARLSDLSGSLPPRAGKLSRAYRNNGSNHHPGRERDHQKKSSWLRPRRPERGVAIDRQCDRRENQQNTGKPRAGSPCPSLEKQKCQRRACERRKHPQREKSQQQSGRLVPAHHQHQSNRSSRAGQRHHERSRSKHARHLARRILVFSTHPKITILAMPSTTYEIIPSKTPPRHDYLKS